MGAYLNVIVYSVAIFMSVLTYFKWKYCYWRNKNVPTIEPQIPFGTSGNPFRGKRNSVITQQSQYHYFKSRGHRFGGLYLFIRPVLLLTDLELIKDVLLKDFQYFTDRGLYHNEKDDPASANIFNLEGDKWRHLRAKVTQLFTSGKLKRIFPSLIACGDRLYTAVNEFQCRKEAIDVKDISERFITDVIGLCAFGLESNGFKETESEFVKYAKMALGMKSKLEVIKLLFILSNPAFARRIGLCISKKSKDFVLGILKDAIAFRNNNNVVCNDFLQVLMDLKKSTYSDLTTEQIVAHVYVFWIAGFETSSAAMAFCLYELAVNQEIQDKVRGEINTILGRPIKNLTYDAIMEMKYLNQVIDETLRKYPPGTAVYRVCIRDYQIPNTNIIIDKGTRVIVPVYALHRDPEFFPDPEKFEPDRFHERNKVNIRPYSYIPFGKGPRYCIGSRFSALQLKVGLVALLSRFKFLLNHKTGFPLEYDHVNLVLKVEGGIWMDIEPVLN